MACDTTALSGVACHTRWKFCPQLCNDMYIKNVKIFTVKSTSRPSLRWLLCSCFAFLFSPQYILLLKGDTTHTVIKPNAARKRLLLTCLQPLCCSQNQLVPCSHHTCTTVLYSFSLRGHLLVLHLSKNYTILLIVQLFCKSYVSVLKKSNKMTR